eukprot:s353_g5.t1
MFASNMRHVLEGSADEILQESALKAFDKDGQWIEQLEQPELPGAFSRRHVSSARHELMSSNGQVLLVDDFQKTKHAALRNSLHEVCHVLGFALPAQDMSTSCAADSRRSARFSEWEELSTNDDLLCPELWVDEGWPPYKALPTVHGRTMPVWSISGGRDHSERSLMVLQARLLNSFPQKQVKALIGYELGRMAFALLSPRIFKAWTDRLSKVFLGGQVLQGVQSMGAGQQKWLPPLLGRTMKQSLGWEQRNSYSLGTIHLSAPQLYANGVLRPIMEFLALDMVLKSAAPRVLRPIVWLGVLMRGGPEALMGSIRDQVEQISPIRRRKSALAPLLRLLSPWLKLLAQLAALHSAGALIATCSRSEVITADRAAALAAGDAQEAAAAIMRVFGQLPLESAHGDELEALLIETAESAKQHQWELRRQALLARYTQPAPEERVRALLRWSETGSAQRLLSLAELRRSSFTSSQSWFGWSPPLSWSFWSSPRWWSTLLGNSFLVVLVALPFLTRMDLIRWASICTLAAREAQRGGLEDSQLETKIRSRATLVASSTSFESSFKLYSEPPGSPVRCNPQGQLWPSPGSLLHWKPTQVQRVSEQSPQALVDLAWSLASNDVTHHPLLVPPKNSRFLWHGQPRRGPSAVNALTLAVTRAEELEARSLGNVVWALAKLLLAGDLITLAAVAQQRAAEMNPQGMANSLWALRKLKHYDQPLLDTFSLQIDAVKCRNFKVQELVNSVWTLAALQCLDLTLLNVVAGEMMARCEISAEKRIQPQDVSNLVWSFSTLGERPVPLLTRLAALSVALAAEFQAQHLANVAWSLAALRLRHEELMRVIQREALGKVQQFRPDGLATLCWSLARTSTATARTLEVLGRRGEDLLRRKGWAQDSMRSENVSMLLEALSLSQHWSLCRSLLDASIASKQRLDGSCFGALHFAARATERRSVLERFAQHMQRSSPVMAALAKGAEVEEVMAHSSLAGHGYAKELMLLQHVLRRARKNHVVSVCETMETFGRGLQVSSKWLKIAGGAKAEVLQRAVAISPAEGITLELGTYCGFSALHLAAGSRVVTVEADLGHALIAQKVIEYAGMSHKVEIITGHTEDVLPWLPQHLGSEMVSLVFMDQRGSRYYEDLEVLKNSGLLMDKAVIVADNVLKPGSPKFLWSILRDFDQNAIVELEEYAMEQVQDWMTVSIFRAAPLKLPVKAEPAEPPEHIRELEFEAQQLRNKTHQPKVGLPGVGFDEWHSFSQSMRQRLCEVLQLSVTIVGVTAPVLLGGLGLPMPASAVLTGLLLLYSSCAWLVWWNHLLGGSRRWAELSSRLTSQLADQADVTAGIAYLTRDWAEMARRSHAALDQEFCGSWRTSLHEVASKLTDIWQDIRNASLRIHPPDMAVDRAKSMRLEMGVKEARLSRSDSAPLAGHASMALQLWLKVDRAVQRALQVEVERMGKALDSDDTKALQAMMSWWSADNSSIAGTAAAACSSIFNGREEERDAGLRRFWTCQSLLGQLDGESSETLGSMLLSERLHRRFQYRSFNMGDEMLPHEESAPRVGIEEFERLEQALSANFESLQESNELKGKLAPMADSAGTLQCPRRRDLAQAAWHLQQMLQGFFAARQKCLAKSDGKLGPDGTLEDSAEDRQDRAAEWRIIFCLGLASLAGAAGIPYAARHLTKRSLSFGFSVANMVLLLNYQRLSLPHVHRRLERQLGHLSSRRERADPWLEVCPTRLHEPAGILEMATWPTEVMEEILSELRELQRSSQKAGAAHARASIFLQSVNVLRNINYVLLCIKTETQRAAAAATGFGASQEMVILGGLRLLLALLPRCEKHWEAEILADEDCGKALAVLANGHAPCGGPLQRLVAESQKRLWILLRMVHLSSVLPIEAQGQLGSLVQRYARPILIEGRVPLQHQPLEMQKSTPREMVEKLTPRVPSSRDSRETRRSTPRGPRALARQSTVAFTTEAEVQNLRKTGEGFARSFFLQTEEEDEEQARRMVRRLESRSKSRSRPGTAAASPETSPLRRGLTQSLSMTASSWARRLARNFYSN